MVEVKILLVRLHTCRECKVRLFERDRMGHLVRHGIFIPDDDIGKYFRAGAEDTPAIVGGSYQPRKRRKKK